MAVFFEGRRAQNSEDNIELGDGGDMTSMVWYFMGWLFFLKNPVSCVKDLKVLLKASNIYNEQSHHYWYSVYSVHTCSFLILFLAPTGNAKQLGPRTDLGPLLGF